jgi:hypothetical protein
MQVNGGALAFSTTPVQQDVTTAVTARVDFGAGTGGQDLVRFWVQTSGIYCDPTGPSSAPGCASFLGSAPVSANVMSAFTGVFWQTQNFAQGGALVDEISVDAIPRPPVGTLCVQKYWDRDEDGTHDFPFEDYLAGWTMNVTGGPSAPFSITTVGPANCRTLTPGTYTVSEVAQPGWAPTTPATRTVTVPSFGITTVKFGNRGVCDPTLPTTTFVSTAGGLDDFAGPQPATKPLGFGSPSRFDETYANRTFYHEFSQLPAWQALCRVRLEIRVRAVSDGAVNDLIVLTAGDLGPTGRWQQYFGLASLTSGTPNPVAPGSELVGPAWKTFVGPVLFDWTFDANGGLPPGSNGGDGAPPKAGQTLFDKFRLALLPGRPFDITVTDDTAVDYIRLTLTYQ